MTEPAASSPTARAARGPAVLELLRRTADEDGFVPFDRFMEVALYGPTVGFYSAEASPFGAEGDYYTAAQVSPLFGRAIAERIKRVAASTPGGGTFRVVEVGPGDGTLGASIVAGLASEPRAPMPIEYVLVERSPTLAVRSFERVSEAGRTVDIPVRAAGGVGADGPFVGFVVANELLDAQPVRRLQWNGEAWLETGVRVRGDRLERTSRPLERPVPPPELPIDLPAGTVLEVSPMAEAIVREVADHLEAGLLLLLDYGMEQSELVVAHPTGTLSAVQGHRFVSDPFEDPGSSDLSVFVNFTRLRVAAARAGLREVSFQRQAEALGAWGFPHLLEEAVLASPSAEAEVRTRLGAKNLLFGFERFRALELEPPAPAPAMPPST